MGVLEHSLNAYSRNLKLMLFFSLPALLAVLIPLASPLPTFVAVGGAYLRTSSMPDLTSFDIAVMGIAFLVSLLLISFATAAICIVVRSQRTLTHIRREVIIGIEKYVLNIFWLFLTAELLYIIVGLVAYDWQVQSWLNPLATLLVSCFLVYAPAALVIDDMRPLRAIEASFNAVRKRPELFLLWIVIAVVSLSLVEFIGLSLSGLVSHKVAQLGVLVINSLFIFPFLVVLQTQIYMAKYPLAR
ncbi:Uncharacterised protein [Candidatus Burarchaeum australiense]|nr:Uncharacterised protein [Candidatus Burarchaeum australiense]